MKKQEMTALEALDSMTGFEEIAITKKFGRSVEEISAESLRTLMRAVAFVVEKREGMSDEDAYAAAMGASLKELADNFETEEDDEIDPDEPETDQGKGSSAPAKKRTSSQR